MQSGSTPAIRAAKDGIGTLSTTSSSDLAVTATAEEWASKTLRSSLVRFD